METILFIPGTLCDARLFSPQVEYLSANKYHVMVMSIAHHHTIHDMAKNILLNAPEKFHLVGLSLGGIVAMEVMRIAPERILSSVLIDTNSKDEPEEKQLARKPQIEKAKSGQMLELLIEDIFPKYTYKINKEIFQLCIEMADSLGSEVFIKQSQAVSQRRDQKGTLESWNKPTLIICGENDIICPLTNHLLIKELIPHSKMEVIPDCGHLPTLEHPKEVNKILLNWFIKLL